MTKNTERDFNELKSICNKQEELIKQYKSQLKTIEILIHIKDRNILALERQVSLLESMLNRKIISWKLWLDDQWNDPATPERHPPEGFIPAHSVARAQMLITIHGMPEFIDFDHDLGDGHDAPELIHWMVEEGNDYNDNYGEYIIPKYNVHSANPCGKATIISLMDTWLRVFGDKVTKRD